MKIRRYESKDKEQIKKLVENILKEIFNSEPRGLEDLSNIKKHFEIFLVAEDKTKIIGTIALRKDVILKRMYVHKNYRNKGLAQKLYDKIEKFTIKKKFKKIKLSTTPQMKFAMSFYKKNGFKKIGKNKKTNQIFFEKKLK
jgi:N-acetylglutamate synthase-like GNAT family acetyltransferase